MTFYQSEDIVLEPVGRDDLDLLALHRNHNTTRRNLTSALPVYSQEDFFKSLGPSNQYFIIKAKGTTTKVGLARITDIDYLNNNAAIGLDIFSSHRRQGWGATSFPVIVKYAFEELGMNHLWLCVLDTNEAAEKIYLQAGFSVEGVLRNHIFRPDGYHDYIVMGLLREEWEK